MKTAAIGAWLPDLGDAKPGSGSTDNHVLKMMPYAKPDRARFVVKKEDLLRSLGRGREVGAFLKNDRTLSATWWNRAYRADPHPGKHLANRAMAVATTAVDLLLFGNDQVARALERESSLTTELSKDEQTRAEQVALHLFMLSHFVADATMPCHCDGRVLTSSKRGKLHNEWETSMVFLTKEY